MSQQKKDNGGSQTRLPVDVKQIKSLIDLMVENDLSRLELREGDAHILLRRGPQGVVAPAILAGPTVGAPPPLPAPVPADAPAAPAETEQEIVVRSPMVGTFYAASDPESPPFVNVGTDVTPDTVVCVVEAMKVFNEIKAEVSGQITRVLVKNAQAVEFDQPLFALGPA